MTKDILKPRLKRGYVLFEVLVAFTILALSVTGIVSALRSTARQIEIAERQSWIQRQFEQVFMEVLRAKQTKLEFEEKKVILLGEFGAEAVAEISPLEIENDEGKIMENLYLIKITITWLDGYEDKSAELETYQYFPLYQH
jgi:type II secretory pathway pseudopilin PulG